MLTTRGFGLRLLCAAGMFILLEGALFRTGFYARLLEPDSSAGILRSILYDEKQRRPSGLPEVLTIGDSRMGLRARPANEISNETGYTFATIAMPGSGPRIWYYMLRDINPTHRRYAAILIGVDEYDDEDYEDIANREMDIRYVTPLLRWSDVVPFAASFPTWQMRWEAARAALFKGYAYRADFQDLLANHKFRMKKLEAQQRMAGDLRYNQPWTDHDLRGLSVDWDKRTIEYPPGSSDSKKEMLRNVLLRETADQTGARGAYRSLWYGRIADLYRGSTTKLIFLRLARGPVARPYRVAYRTAAVRELAARNPQVILLPEHAFDSLEQPVNFGDPLHLNERGAQEFSRMAARQVAHALGR